MLRVVQRTRLIVLMSCFCQDQTCGCGLITMLWLTILIKTLLRVTRMQCNTLITDLLSLEPELESLLAGRNTQGRLWCLLFLSPDVASDLHKTVVQPYLELLSCETYGPRPLVQASPALGFDKTALRSIDRFLASLSGSYSCYFHGNFSTIMYDYIPSTFAIIMYFDVVDVVHFRSVLLQDGIYIHR